MSAIASNWSPAETNSSITRAAANLSITRTAACGRAHPREEEFRSALADYMAGYVAEQQKRRAPETVLSNRSFAVVLRFVGWMQAG